MEAHTQSYNMFDSKIFKRIKPVQKLLLKTSNSYSLGQTKKLSQTEQDNFQKVL